MRCVFPGIILVQPVVYVSSVTVITGQRLVLMATVNASTVRVIPLEYIVSYAKKAHLMLMHQLIFPAKNVLVQHSQQRIRRASQMNWDSHSVSALMGIVASFAIIALTAIFVQHQIAAAQTAAAMEI